jgi:hypothetical protein
VLKKKEQEEELQVKAVYYYKSRHLLCGWASKACEA